MRGDFILHTLRLGVGRLSQTRGEHSTVLFTPLIDELPLMFHGCSMRRSTECRTKLLIVRCSRLAAWRITTASSLVQRTSNDDLGSVFGMVL